MTRPVNYGSEEMLAKEAVAWAEAERKGQFCYGDLAAIAHTNERNVKVWADKWVTEGKVRLIAGHQCRRERKWFEVVPAGEITVPVQGDAYEQMWFVMRRSPRGFSPVDLVAQVAVTITKEEARAYCRHLLEAKYLTVVKKAGAGRCEAIYRLTNATGVKAPRAKRLTCVVDFNTGRVCPMVEVRHG